MKEKPLRLPGDCVLRLLNYAMPGSPLYDKLHQALHPVRPRSGAPIFCVVVCDAPDVSDLLDIAALYTPQDVHTISDAYNNAFQEKL